MSDIQTIVDNRLKAPQAFFTWTKTFFPRYEWANKKKNSSQRTVPNTQALSVNA